MIMLETKEDNFNHACCVCQVSLNNRPFNPNLQTSHGYCEACLEVALSTVVGRLDGLTESER